MLIVGVFAPVQPPLEPVTVGDFEIVAQVGAFHRDEPAVFANPRVDVIGVPIRALGVADQIQITDLGLLIGAVHIAVDVFEVLVELRRRRRPVLVRGGALDQGQFGAHIVQIFFHPLDRVPRLLQRHDVIVYLFLEAGEPGDFLGGGNKVRPVEVDRLLGPFFLIAGDKLLGDQHQGVLGIKLIPRQLRIDDFRDGAQTNGHFSIHSGWGAPDLGRRPCLKSCRYSTGSWLPSRKRQRGSF